MSETRKKRILCVDNHEDSCELIAAIMGYEDFDVDKVITAREGLRKAQQGDYDLIILDLHLEDDSGLAVCQQIRQFDSRTPILFYSAEARTNKIEEALATGAQGFLVKPVDPDDLQTYVRRYTGSLGAEARDSRISPPVA
jgi:DNA-binding response OmpR family regulator